MVGSDSDGYELSANHKDLRGKPYFYPLAGPLP